MFLETLREIRGGAFNAEAGERLREVVQAVQATGKAGKVTLVLTVKPASKSDNQVLTLSDQMKVTLPQIGAGETVLFATKEGGLSRRDSRQPELMGLREVKPALPMTPRNEEEQVAQ